MNQQDRIVVAHRPTLVDDFLCSSLHLRVAALHGREVEVRRARAAAHRRSGAAAETNQHGRTAEHDDLRAARNIAIS